MVAFYIENKKIDRIYITNFSNFHLYMFLFQQTYIEDLKTQKILITILNKYQNLLQFLISDIVT